MEADSYDVPDPESQYQHVALPHTDHIRILVVQPSDHIGAPVDCDIEVVPLDRTKSQYVALSYTWGMEADGDASFNRSIMISGKPKAMTQNLFECLRRVRHRAEPLRIWIDAICINQTDDDEKASQVANMAEVYANAQSTVVWLGERDRNGNDTEMFALLKCLSAGEHRQHSLKEHSWRDIDGQVYVRCDAITSRMTGLSRAQTNEIVSKILQFLKRRYFTRRWVVQELRRSGEIAFHWSRYRMPLQEFMRALKTLQDFSLYSGCGMDKYSARIHSELAVTMVNRIRLLKAYAKMTLLELLMDCSENECSDPRDRLFALSSLDRGASIKPNYSVPFTTLYIDFARLLISQGHIEAVFRNLRYKRAALVDGLPTWVPDLRFPFSTLNRDHKIDADLKVRVDENNMLFFEPFYIGVIRKITPIRHYTDAGLQLTVDKSVATIEDGRISLSEDLGQHTYHERESQDAAHHFETGDELYCNWNSIETDSDAHQLIYLIRSLETTREDPRIVRTFSGSSAAQTFTPMFRATTRKELSIV